MGFQFPFHFEGAILLFQRFVLYLFSSCVWHSSGGFDWAPLLPQNPTVSNINRQNPTNSQGKFIEFLSKSGWILHVNIPNPLHQLRKYNNYIRTNRMLYYADHWVFRNFQPSFFRHPHHWISLKGSDGQKASAATPVRVWTTIHQCLKNKNCDVKPPGPVTKWRFGGTLNIKNDKNHGGDCSILWQVRCSFASQYRLLQSWSFDALLISLCWCRVKIKKQIVKGNKKCEMILVIAKDCKWVITNPIPCAYMIYLVNLPTSSLNSYWLNEPCIYICIYVHISV